jgi:hypothetical protein
LHLHTSLRQTTPTTTLHSSPPTTTFSAILLQHPFVAARVRSILPIDPPSSPFAYDSDIPYSRNIRSRNYAHFSDVCLSSSTDLFGMYHHVLREYSFLATFRRIWRVPLGCLMC